MVFLWLIVGFVAGVFFTIGAGAFLTYLKVYEYNRKHIKNDN